jgi:NAD(P)-dependent dehydrogenase (short-subunit alcohol dehydrogenase family)
VNGLTGKHIVVTGAARGIGAALAAELRARGAEPVTVDVAAGADMTCDVSDAGQVSAS